MMEDQGRRLLLAVAAAFAIMLLWSVIFPPDKDEEEPETDEAGEVTDAEGAPSDGSTKPDGDGALPNTPVDSGDAVAVQRGEEKDFVFEYETYRATVSTYGANLKSWKLLGTKFEDRTVEGDPPLELVPTGAAENARQFEVSFTNSSTLQIPAETEWVADQKNADEIWFTWDSAELSIEKQYKFYPDEYLVRVTVTVTKNIDGDVQQQLAVAMHGFQDPDADTGGGWTTLNREWKASCDVGGTVRKRSSKELIKDGGHGATGQIRWGGYTHSYFLVAAAVDTRTNDSLDCYAATVDGRDDGAMRVDLVFPVATLEKGIPHSKELFAYFGPGYLDRLEALERHVGYNPQFDDAVNLGDYIGFLVRPLLMLLLWFQSFTINWGIAIVLLTLTVKLATLYWTTKSMRSMKAMSKLSPKVKAMQKKYKDDKQRQQVEIMNLYKAHKVNPLAGCLPMILQMPIWIALYRMLMRAAELYQAPLIPGWIDDMTVSDPLYILPIAVMAMMFLQARLSPTQADSTQQKVMMYGLPLMFGVFSFFFPAGLVLYILTNTTLTALHHVWMNRNDPHKDLGKDIVIEDEESGKGSDKQSNKKAVIDVDATEVDTDDDADADDGAANKAQPRRGAQKGKKKPNRGKRGGKKKRSAK
jgi:YidC/Oxa1 family membrane protein insertase